MAGELKKKLFQISLEEIENLNCEYLKYKLLANLLSRWPIEKYHQNLKWSIGLRAVGFPLFEKTDNYPEVMSGLQEREREKGREEHNNNLPFDSQ